MSGTLVVGAAPAPGAEAFYRTLVGAAAHVVAADAAGEWCVALGRRPDVVVGDFDSASPGARERLTAGGIELVEHPVDKDRTDLELAADLAAERFGGPVVLTAAFTSRLDHTLAALGSLVRAGAGASAREPGWTAWVCREQEDLVLRPPLGSLLSVIAPCGARGVGISGVRWPLRDAEMGCLAGLGVSNEVLAAEVRVCVGSGALIVFVAPSEDMRL